MDAKDLRIETALGERNDGSKYSQSGVAIQNVRNKPYRDIGSNPLAKAEATVRPCAVIGPDRVVPPPASNEPYLKKVSVDPWTYPESVYPRPPEYPHKPINNVNPMRNISPRQTFQENMPRIMVSPTYSTVKHATEANSRNVQDQNELSKNIKHTSTEAKYCDVPYSVNYLSNESKTVREPEMCVPSVNSPLMRTAPHAWPPSGVNRHTSRMYGTPDMYQYPQHSNCTVPRPSVVSMTRPHRTFPEEAGYYPDSYYQDASVRFKPYPAVKDRYPQARYDYINNYPSPFHPPPPPPPPYLPNKYDIPNSRTHPYPMYPHLKYLENRVPEPNTEGYQRSNQHFNMPMGNNVTYPSYPPGIGNTPSKLPLHPDASNKTLTKTQFDNNKTYVDYENAKLKYAVPEFYVNEMARAQQVQKPVAIPNYASPGLYPIQMQQYQRKDNSSINKPYDYMPHYRHFEHPFGFNPLSHQVSQFSPSAIAISPTDSNTSIDNHTQVTSQEDCGYVSQSSSASVRSMDSGISRLHNEYYRRHDYRYQPLIGNSHNLSKLDTNSTNSKDNSKINVRQFLSMWNEGDDDNSTDNTKDETIPKLTDPNDLLKSKRYTKSQDQLYVLGLVNVPNEELAKYEHIQKVSKLPENIKGYNNIELLNQFEEVIECSNMNNFKSISAKEFMSMKDRKNVTKRVAQVLPRPVSPLDVEAKISQSIIHKDVGCNFEIKPCSPKMMNVEIASPVQNIFCERAIEKVNNPNKAKSPLTMRIDGNNHKIKSHENNHITYENSSCKMVGSPFTTDNTDPAKSNYSLQDLETNSGVCLASLPRLDNEIELNFLEVNQQFINANKRESHLLHRYSDSLSQNTEDDVVMTTTSNDIAKTNSEMYCKEPAEQIDFNETREERKSAIHNLGYQENKSNANAIRKDSVIIENPENVKKQHEEKHPYKFGDVFDNIPMNLTSQNNLHVVSKSETTCISKIIMDQTECALDFSQHKSENELPVINAFDNLTHDTLIETDFNVDNKTVIEGIVENEPSTSSSSIKKDDAIVLVKSTNTLIDKPHENVKEHSKKSKIPNLSDTTEKTVIEAKTHSISNSKETTPNVIVKHKYRHKMQLHRKIMKKGKGGRKEINAENKLLNSPFKNSSHHDFNKQLQQESNICVENVCENHDVITGADSDNQKKVDQTDSTTSNFYGCHTNVISENMEVKLCVNTPSNTDQKSKPNKMDMIDVSQKNIAESTDNCVKDTTICKQSGVMDRNAKMNNPNKYYSDLIAVSELLVLKNSNPDIVKPLKSILHNDSFAADIVEPKQSVAQSLNDARPQSDETVILESTKLQEDENEHVKIEECSVDNNKISRRKCDNVEPKSVTHLFDDDMNSADGEIRILERKNIQEHKNKLFKKKVCTIDNYNFSMDKCIYDESSTLISKTSHAGSLAEEQNELVINTLTDQMEILEKRIEINDYDNFMDPNCSIDSVYQSKNNSFGENNKSSFTNIAGDEISHDSVSIEKETQCNRKCVNSAIESDTINKKVHEVQSVTETADNNKISEDIFQSHGQVCTIENQVYDAKNSNHEMELSILSPSVSMLYDRVDANMQKLFEQPSKKIIPETVNIKSNKHSCSYVQTENENNSYKNYDYPKSLHGNQQLANVESDGQELDSEMDYGNIKESHTGITETQKRDIKEKVQNYDLNGVETKNIKKQKTDQIGSVKICDWLLTKQFSALWSKKIYCPIIQKLISNEEGKIFYHRVINSSLENVQGVLKSPFHSVHLRSDDTMSTKVNADKSTFMGNILTLNDYSEVITDEICKNKLSSKETVTSKISEDKLKSMDINPTEAITHLTDCAALNSDETNTETINSIIREDKLEFLDKIPIQNYSNDVNTYVTDSSDLSSEATTNSVLSVDKLEFLDNITSQTNSSEVIADVTNSAENTTNSEISVDKLEVLDYNPTQNDSNEVIADATDSAENTTYSESCVDKIKYLNNIPKQNESNNVIADVTDMADLSSEHTTDSVISENKLEFVDTIFTQNYSNEVITDVTTSTHNTADLCSELTTNSGICVDELNCLNNMPTQTDSNAVITGVSDIADTSTEGTTHPVISVDKLNIFYNIPTKTDSNAVVTDVSDSADLSTEGATHLGISGVKLKKLHNIPTQTDSYEVNDSTDLSSEVATYSETRVSKLADVTDSVDLNSEQTTRQTTNSVISVDKFKFSDTQTVTRQVTAHVTGSTDLSSEDMINSEINVENLEFLDNLSTQNDSSEVTPDSADFGSKVTTSSEMYVDKLEFLDNISVQNYSNKIITNVTHKEYDSTDENDCIVECDVHNDSTDAQDISFRYTNNLIISQVTENILHKKENVSEFNDDRNENKIESHGININDCSPVRYRRPLKRSLSDSDLNLQGNHNNRCNVHFPLPPKRNKICEFENCISSNRRNSVTFEENVSFCILIDENCIITEDNENKICIADLEGNYITTEINTESNVDNTDPIKDLLSNVDETNVELTNPKVFQCRKENCSPWIQEIVCVDTVFSDEVAENVVISAPTSPTDSTADYNDQSVLFDSTSSSYTNKVKLLHGEKMSYEDAQLVDTLYRTPHMDIMNKTLLYGDQNISDSDQTNISDDDQEIINLESDDWKASPTHNPDYIDPLNASSEFHLETPENKENVFVKELSPLRRIDDYLDVSSAENDGDEHILPKDEEGSNKGTQDGTIRSCESSLDDVFDYKLKYDSITTKTSTCSTPSSSEVSSTTSEEKNSSILLKITNLNGSRVSQINEVEKSNKPRCKFTENNVYSTSNLNFPNRPLMTKAAQKYIPPIEESILDLKVRITLPQQRLLQLKQMKLSQSEPKPTVRQQHSVPRIPKKIKPNFDDVLKSIDEMQLKKRNEKRKKTKTVVIPKVVIKKSENGSHYASTPKKDTFNPDLTGRKWQPWVFLEKNIFIDRMAVNNKTRAIFSYRKNTFVLAENFKKYKSVNSTKFIISPPRTPGELKYTIRLKHHYSA